MKTKPAPGGVCRCFANPDLKGRGECWECRRYRRRRLLGISTKSSSDEDVELNEHGSGRCDDRPVSDSHARKEDSGNGSKTDAGQTSVSNFTDLRPEDPQEQTDAGNDSLPPDDPDNMCVTQPLAVIDLSEIPDEPSVLKKRRR